MTRHRRRTAAPWWTACVGAVGFTAVVLADGHTPSTSAPTHPAPVPSSATPSGPRVVKLRQVPRGDDLVGSIAPSVLPRERLGP